MSTYRWIDLVTRDIDCSTITEEEFVRAMFSDILEAEEKYNELYTPEHIASILDYYDYTIRTARDRATKYAEKKWKTEKKRKEYIQSEIKKARENYKIDRFYYDLSFFDFDVNPGKMGLSGNCCIYIKELTIKKLINCFNEVKDNKYFKKAKGWKLTYECSENSYRASFRPQIKLIVDEETEAQMEKDRKDLTDSVNKFYEGCTYWGD